MPETLRVTGPVLLRDPHRPMREILRASAVSTGGFLASMILGAATVKILATMLGPAGMGLFALLRQTHLTCVTLGSFGGQNTIAQGLANRRDGGGLGPYARTLGSALLLVGVVLTAALLLLSPLASSVFPSAVAAQAPGLVRWLVVPILLGLVVVALNGLLSAWRDVGGLSIAQFANAVVMLLLAWPAARLARMGHPTALVALMACALVGALAMGGLRVRLRGYARELRRASQARPGTLRAREFLAFPMGALVVSGAATATLLAVRALLSRHLDLAVGGLFDTAWSLSLMYVWILLASLTTWYLPTLARMDQAAERGQLITRFLRYALAVTIPAAIGLCVLKPLVVRLLFSEAFLPSLELWRWFLLSDSLRAASWVLAMVAFARGDMRPYIGAELAWNAGFLLLALLSVHLGSFEPLGPGVLVLHAGYLTWFVAYTRRHHAFRPGAALLVRWGAGLVALAIAAILCWDDVTVGGVDLVVCGALSALCLLLAPTHGEWARIGTEAVRLVNCSLTMAMIRRGWK